MLTLTHDEAEDLKTVVRHLYDDEEKHYQSCGAQEREGHIFDSIRRLAEKVKGGGSEAEIKETLARLAADLPEDAG